MAATIVPLICLAVIVFVLWVAVRATIEARRHPQRAESIPRSQEELRRIRHALRDRLDREPLGAVLAGRLWQRLTQASPGDGLIHEFHRDFCGHGLIRTEAGIMLCDVGDGGGYFGDPIASWTAQADFVAFFARQSDFTMSGWAPDEPVFFTEDDWYRNNQRLTRTVLERYLSRL